MQGEELSLRKNVQSLSSSKPWQTIRGGLAIVGRHPPFPGHTGKCSWIHRQTHTHLSAHILLPSSLLPLKTVFKLRAVCHCHIFFTKSQLNLLKTMSVCVCVCLKVWLLLCKKNLIGKLYLEPSRDCSATVNDLSEKCIPECTWGALALGWLLNDLWECDSC